MGYLLRAYSIRSLMVQSESNLDFQFEIYDFLNAKLLKHSFLLYVCLYHCPELGPFRAVLAISFLLEFKGDWNK